MKKKLSIIITALILSILAAGCSVEIHEDSGKQDAKYYLYDISSDETQLQKESYSPEETTADYMLKDMMQRMNSQQTDSQNRVIRSFCCLRKIRVFWFAAIPVFLFGIYLAFLFNDGIKKLNFQVYKEKRTEIVQMVQNNQIKIRKDMELIELPEDYKKCSSGGKAVVRQNNGSYTVGFWYTQGFLDSGFSLFAYSNDDSRTDVIQMVKEYGGIEYEINLSEKEKGWYYVTAKVGE